MGEGFWVKGKGETQMKISMNFSRRRSEHTDRKVELKPMVLFRTTPTRLKIIITWCFRKPFYDNKDGNQFTLLSYWPECTSRKNYKYHPDIHCHADHLSVFLQDNRSISWTTMKVVTSSRFCHNGLFRHWVHFKNNLHCQGQFKLTFISFL